MFPVDHRVRRPRVQRSPFGMVDSTPINPVFPSPMQDIALDRPVIWINIFNIQSSIYELIEFSIPLS